MATVVVGCSVLALGAGFSVVVFDFFIMRKII